MVLALALTLVPGVAFAEKATLRFVDTIPDQNRQRVYQELIDEFNAKHDDVQIVYESVPWDQAHQKLVVMAGADNLPDILYVHTNWFSEFQSAGWVLPLDNYYRNWALKDDLLPYVQKVLIDQDQVVPFGQIIGIPCYLATHALFVRTDWLNEAGIAKDSLKTWDDIFAASAKLTDKAKNRYGFSFRGGRGGFDHMMFYVAAQTGGKLYDDKGVCTFNTPEAKAAVERFCAMYKNGEAPQDAANWGFQEMVQGFTAGLVGILNQNADVIANCKDVMQEGTWDTIPFPKSNVDGKMYSKADGFLYSISSDSKYPDAAWAFIDFLLQPENNTKTCVISYNNPVTKTANQNEVFGEGPMASYSEALLDPAFVRRPLYGYFAEVAEFQETFADSELQKYILGVTTLDQFCDNIANFLTTAQQKYMAEHPNVPIPSPSAIG